MVPVNASAKAVGEQTGELNIAVAPTNMRGRGTRSQQLSLVPVNKRRDMGQFVSYKNRGCIFPWDDIETATEVCFKSKVAEKREELKNTYGEWKDETDDELSK